MEKSLIELKADAYDTLAQIEFLQGKLQQLNQAIAQKSQQEQSKMKIEK